MNAAGSRPGVKADTGDGGGNFFRLGDGVNKPGQPPRVPGVFDLHRTDVRRFHPVAVGDVHRIMPGVTAKGVDGVGGHLSHYQSGESSRAESFVKKKSSLDRAESETYKSALTGK